MSSLQRSYGAGGKASAAIDDTGSSAIEDVASKTRASFQEQEQEVDEHPLHIVSGAYTIARGLFLHSLLSSDSFIEAIGYFLDVCYRSALKVTTIFFRLVAWVLQLLQWVLGMHQESPGLSTPTTGGIPAILPNNAAAPFRTRYSALKKGVIHPAAAFVDTFANAIVTPADSFVESFCGVIGFCAEAALTVGLSLFLHAISVTIAIGWSCLQLSATIVGRLYPCVEELLMSRHGPLQKRGNGAIGAERMVAAKEAVSKEMLCY